MLSAIFICSVYVLLLLVITKLFGVKYTEIIKNTENIKKGIVFPIGIGATFLVIFAFIFNWLPDILTFNPRVSSVILWIIPIVTALSIIFRFIKANISYFEKNGLILLILGTALVGLSEEILVRGIAVTSLQNSGFSIFWIGILSSLIFGTLHFMNYFNGQPLKKTSIQVAGTILMGLNFYFILIITGSLWVPILVHFLYDLSILMLGPDPKLSDTIVTKFISITTILMFILPLFGLFFIY